MNDTTCCAICGGSLETTLLTINAPDRFERWVGVTQDGYQRRWLACGTCGSSTNALQPNVAALLPEMENNYYAIDFPNGDLKARYDKIMNLPADQSDNAQRVGRIVAQLKDWAGTKAGAWRMADIGGGLGVFVSRLQQVAGADLALSLAVEPDPVAAAHLKALGLFPVVAAPYPSPGVPDNLDLVTVNKVLEHVSAPLPFLASIRSALKPAGLVYVEVPDVLTATTQPPHDNILGVMHRHLYSVQGLVAVMTRAGFEVLRVERIVEPSGKLTVFAFAAPQGACAYLLKAN